METLCMSRVGGTVADDKERFLSVARVTLFDVVLHPAEEFALHDAVDNATEDDYGEEERGGDVREERDGRQYNGHVDAEGSESSG